MLSLFRINDPYRLTLVFLVLLALRLPYFLVSDMTLIQELNFFLLGEKIHSGSTLYTEIWDETGSLSAFVYWVLHTVFGRSQLAYQVVNLLLVTFQCALFNRLLLNNKALNENTYVPAVLYAVLMSLFFDFNALTPAVLGNTFILMALNKVFAQVEFRAKHDQSVLYIGLFLSVATLFYLPYFVFGLAALFILGFFTGTNFRGYMQILYGYLLPFLFLFTYYFYIDGLGSLYYNFLNPLFSFQKTYLLPLSSFLMVSAVPFLFLLMSLVRVNQRARLTNYQERLIQLMYIWLFFGLLSLIFITEVTANNLIIFVPALAFYMSHYFLLIKKRLLAELSFLILFVMIIMVNLGTYFQFFFTHRHVQYQSLLVDKDKQVELISDKRILVIGKNEGEYMNASLATPYLDWKISSPLFKNLGYYDNLTDIYLGISRDLPEVIIDKEGIVPALFEKLPTIAHKYKRLDKGTYQLKTLGTGKI